MSGFAWFGRDKTPARENEQVLACYDHGGELIYTVLIFMDCCWWNHGNEQHIAPARWQYITPPPKTAPKENMKPVHALHRPRRDGSAKTFCGRLVYPTRTPRGAVPIWWRSSKLDRKLRAVRPGYDTATTCKVCLQVRRLTPSCA